MKEVKDENQHVFVRVEYWDEKNTTYANWMGADLRVDQIKEGAMAILEQLTENQTSFVINDNREITGVWDEVNDWIANEWMPRAIGAGMRKFAHILSSDLFSQLSAEFMEENSKEIEGDFQLRTFGNLEEVEKWLTE